MVVAAVCQRRCKLPQQAWPPGLWMGLGLGSEIVPRCRCTGNARLGGLRGLGGGSQCTRGSARAPDLAGSCRAKGALTRACVQDPASSCGILHDPARPD
eukprot:7366290-Pyramimonas_sp.AAC.1